MFAGSFRCVGIIFCALVLFETTQAQSLPTKNVPEVVDLVQAAGTATTLPDAAWITNPRCDAEENYYFQPAEGTSELNEPIIKIDKEGQQKVTFTMPQGTNAIGNFFVGKEGTVFRPGINEKGVSVVLSYRKDGTLKSIARLDVPPQFVPSNLAVFGSGDFLVSGYVLPFEPDDKAKPFTGTFKSDGSLVKKLTPDGDEPLPRPADVDQTDSMGAITFGRVVVGSDGNSYLMRKTLPARIYALSPAGDVVRTLEVDSDGTGQYPMGLTATEGSLAIAFRNVRETGPMLIKVLDLQGNTTRSYTVDPKHAGMLVCYSPPRFTLLGDGQKLIGLEPR